MAINTFLTAAGDKLTVASNNQNVFGSTGTQTVLVNSGVTGIAVSNTVERIELAGNMSTYKFVTVTGTGLQIQDSTGAVVGTVASTEGATVAFADGSAALVQTPTSFTIGGTAVAVGVTGAAATVTPTTPLNATDKSTVTGATTTTPTFSVTAGAAPSEGGNATFTVTLSSPVATGSVNVTLAAGSVGSSTIGTDTGTMTASGTGITLAGAVLTFAAGSTTATVTIPVTADAVSPETGEGVSLTLSAPSTGTAVAATPTAQVLFTDVPVTYTITASAANVFEGAAITYTLTASAPAPVGGTSVDFSVVAGDIAAANQSANNKTNLNDFAAGAFNPFTVVMAAGTTTATYVVSSSADAITETPEDYSVKAVIGGVTVATKTTSLLDGNGNPASTGQTFLLTTGPDAPVATSGDDTFTAADTATPATTWTAADVIDGLVGNDTLNVVTAAAVTGAPVGATVTSVENVKITSGAGVTLNTVTSSALFTGLTALTVNSVGATTLTVPITTSVTLTDAVTAAAVSVTGGSSITAALSGVTTGGGALAIGSSTTAGAIAVTKTEVNTTAVTGTTLTVAGGTTVSVTENITAGTSGTGTAIAAIGGTVTVNGGALTTAVTVNQTAPVTAVAGVASVTEFGTVTFGGANMAAGESVTVAGLTYTANGATTPTQVGAIFASLTAGANANTASVIAAVAASTGKGSISGVLQGYNTGANVGGAVVFTSTSAGSDVPNLEPATTSGAGALTVGYGTITKGVAPITAVDGITDGAVGITDVNSASATLAGVIKTVSLTNSGAATVNSSALDTINLTGRSGGLTVTQGALNTPTVTTQALNVNGVTGGPTVTLGSPITTLNITGSTASSTIGSLVAPGATTLNVLGTAAVTLTAHTLASLTSVVNTNTAGLTMRGTALSNTTSYAGSSGIDGIQVGATTKAINLGEGVNTLTISTGVTALGTGGSVASGSNATDVLRMDNADATTASLTTTFASKVTGFERLVLTAPATNTIDVAKLLGATNASYVTVTGGAFTTTLDNLATTGTGATVIISGANTGMTTGGTAGAGIADILNVTLTESTGTATVAFGTLTTPNIENIKITMADTATIPLGTFQSSATLTDAAASTITVSGNEGLNLTFTGNALTSFDASGLTLGGLTWTTGPLQYASIIKGSAVGGDTIDANAALASVTITEVAGTNTITGSSGGVTGLVGNTLTGGTGFDTIVGGTGVDVIVVGAGTTGNTVTGSNSADTIDLTGSTGVDTIKYGALATVTHAAGTGNATAGTDMDTITGFQSGVDKIQLLLGVTTVGSISGLTLTAASTAAAMGAVVTDANSVATVADVYTRLEVDLLTTTNAFAASTAAAGGIVAREVTFTTGAAAGTYLVINDSVASFQPALDQVIKLVGTTTFAAGDIVVGS
jgi:S-layer protein